MELLTGVDPSVLPEWADPELVVRISGHGNALFAIAGNPHTFRGLLAVHELATGQTISVRPSQITEATEFARGWLRGYLSGNEPSPPPNDALEAMRWERERLLFHAYEREMPPQSLGRYVIDAIRTTDGISVAETSRAISAVFAKLAVAHSLWRNNRWLPVTEDRASLPPIGLATADEVVDAFRCVNPAYAIDGTLHNWQMTLRVINAQTDACAAGLIEVIVWLDTSGPVVDQIHVVVNLERPDLVAAADDTTPEKLLEAVLGAVIIGIDPDVASVAHGDALYEGEPFSIEPADESADPTPPILPGPLTYVATRRRSDLDCIADLPFDRQPVGSGVLIRHRGGFTMTTTTANELSRALGSAT
ncbi:hypothetical protein GTV32_04040 [Gordonia sp. SID5947]|uniref:hypothetical protein n=1 Tax=Gordonia sp. SID5947 TaxID=2690315 RepID=UPI001371EB38|nr:hypothetical protein [Gordonia sp. SID5947]MYR05532.1 hypothetical protein [Gordonia sp. SID5947]